MAKKKAITVDVVVNRKELFKSFLADDVYANVMEIQDSIVDLEMEKFNLIAKAWPDFWAVEHAVPMEWKCEKSPFGSCAYHKFEDRAWDHCLFCGEPYERK